MDPRVVSSRTKDGACSNQVYSIEFVSDDEGKSFDPLEDFGVAYDFSLGDAIQGCREYVVPLNAVKRMALEFGLELVQCQNFGTLIHEKVKDSAALELLDQMSVLSKRPLSLAEWEACQLYVAMVFRKVVKEKT
eukprot:CAMPEP_0184008844 /NCGR_PEP_ID=MMETSP0954-20121128/2228_1 /TAXON_ID=627963 /ORGANISM="Aplanochytrium sp, Strain PBS07" /LENGTH=133 /DNA_ID=CAMNT_0026288057 /DNA_START=456 /DNA_END=857 /DNA_ORIENTATION=-